MDSNLIMAVLGIIKDDPSIEIAIGNKIVKVEGDFVVCKNICREPCPEELIFVDTTFEDSLEEGAYAKP